MTAYSIELKKGIQRGFHEIWDQVRNGYIPILPIGFDINGTVGKRNKATIMNSLELLHVPHSSYNSPLTATTDENIRQCSKLHFLVSLLDEIRNAKCPITLAVVGSNIEREALFKDALDVYNLQYNATFSTLHTQGKTKTPLYGVRVQFATKESLEKVNDPLEADYVIVYDSALIPERNYILTNFRGVTYAKPGIVSLATLYSPDIRLCNYRDAHPDNLQDPTVKVKTLTPLEVKFFNSLRYKRAHRDTRIRSNRRMVKQVKNWMFLNDHTIFKPLSLTYRNCHSMQSHPHVGAKDEPDNKQDDTKSKETPDCKSKEVTSCSMNPTQKRAQLNARSDSPKKLKTGQDSGDFIMLDDFSEDEAPTVGRIDDPIEILSSSEDDDDDAMSLEVSDSDSGDPTDPQRNTSPSISDSSGDDTPPNDGDVEENSHNKGDVTEGTNGNEEAAEDIEEVSKEATKDKEEEEASKDKEKEEASKDKEKEETSKDKEEEEASKDIGNTEKDIEEENVNETMESVKTSVVTVVSEKSTAPQSTLTKSLNIFQMELDQLHAEFVRRISQN